MATPLQAPLTNPFSLCRNKPFFLPFLCGRIADLGQRATATEDSTVPLLAVRDSPGTGTGSSSDGGVAVMTGVAAAAAAGTTAAVTPTTPAAEPSASASAERDAQTAEPKLQYGALRVRSLNSRVAHVRESVVFLGGAPQDGECMVGGDGGRVGRECC